MSEAGTYLYVSQAEAQKISVLKLADATGELSSVQEVDVGGKVMPLAVSPDHRFLYAALRSKPDWKIVSFAIDGGSGQLTKLGEAPAFNSTVYICTDHTGCHLLAANNPNNYDHRTGVLAINAIGKHGAVQAPFEIYRTAPKLHAVIPDPSNRYLLATSCDGDAILRFAFDEATGTINPEPLSPVLIERRRGPRHLIFHPNNRFLYLLNEYDASVYVFRYDVHTGRLFELQIAAAPPPGYVPQERGRLGISAAGADIHFTPDGRYLYASVRGSKTMALFSVDPVTGLVTHLNDFLMPDEPRGFAIDPHGRYLFCAGDKVAKLATFAIDQPSGKLTQLGEISTGEGPNWIECVRLP
jgi:6-phosphogluconolactonase